jgi:uncharacterized membrane protein YfcA
MAGVRRDRPPANDARRVELARAAALGVLAGFLSGLFGVGGGILIVPGLVLLMSLDQRLAHGTSLAAIVPIAVAGVVGYAVSDSVDWPVALCLVAGSSFGAVAGTHALHVLPVKVLSTAFAVALLATAARLFVDVPDASGRDPLDAGTVVALVLLGLLAGTLSGMLGVGGGIVMVPGQVLLFGITDAVAKGTSLAVIIPTAVVATARNLRRGNAALPLAAAVGGGGVLSGLAASQLAVRMDATLSSVLFGLLLVATATRMLVVRGRDA